MQTCKSSSTRCSSGSFQWHHCVARGKRQITSGRNVNNAITQVHCEVRLTLGKQDTPARPNSIGVREGDKLKVVRFPRSFAITSTPSPKCSLDSQCVPIRCSLPVKQQHGAGSRRSISGSANKRLASNAVFSGFALRHQSYSRCP